MRLLERTWFTLDGALDHIDYQADSSFRFPLELARLVIEAFSTEGEVVLDPFCGFGTTVVAAEQLGRVGVGIEHEQRRAAFAATRISPPSRIFRADARHLADLDLPPVDLVFTSPPYTTFRHWTGDLSPDYWHDFGMVFTAVRNKMKVGGVVALDVSNVRESPELIRPLAFEAALRLANLFRFEHELARCNESAQYAGPGFNHSHVFVFRRVE